VRTRGHSHSAGPPGRPGAPEAAPESGTAGGPLRPGRGGWPGSRLLESAGSPPQDARHGGQHPVGPAREGSDHGDQAVGGETAGRAGWAGRRAPTGRLEDHRYRQGVAQGRIRDRASRTGFASWVAWQCEASLTEATADHPCSPNALRPGPMGHSPAFPKESELWYDKGDGKAPKSWPLQAGLRLGPAGSAHPRDHPAMGQVSPSAGQACGFPNRSRMGGGSNIHTPFHPPHTTWPFPETRTTASPEEFHEHRPRLPRGSPQH
jgi:hypothetical protein